jgi:hypothetical protein
VPGPFAWKDDDRAVRFGRYDVRPLGGPLGCLVMILVSIALSVVLTFLLNVFLR